jgi:hypothetical protein
LEVVRGASVCDFSWFVLPHAGESCAYRSTLDQIWFFVDFVKIFILQDILFGLCFILKQICFRYLGISFSINKECFCDNKDLPQHKG